MNTKNFSYKFDKGNCITPKKIKNINFKSINVFLIIFVLVSISLFPLTKVKAASTYTQRLTNGIESFPESYQNLLRQFVEDNFHENWNFQAYYTGIDWNDFIANESIHGKNRVHQDFDIAYRCSCNNLASGYYCANSQITAYFIDPRNFINERNIFQFLDVSYNEQIYTKNIVEKLVSKYKVFNEGKLITFVMSDENHKDYNKQVTMTFTDIIMEASAITKMSPISMVIKIVQEIGVNGSASTTGNNSTYPNTYNFFNIGSSDTGDAILNGLKYASDHGWHCPYTSIIEGAEFNSSNYIKAGQNTAYFYKYDCVGNKILSNGEIQEVTSDDLYHQYMTNIQDPYSQSASLFDTYTNNDLLKENLNFIIPVFNNMPEEPIDKISSLSNSNQELYYADVTSALTIRDAPNGKYIKTLYKDDLVIMLQRNYTELWDKIQLWDGQVGFTKTEYLEPFVPNTGSGIGGDVVTPSEDFTKPVANIGYGYADVSSSLNVRKGAGTSFAIIASLPPKAELLILEETNGWYKIKMENNVTGYVTKEYVKMLEYIKVDEENKTISVIPNMTANVVAGKMNATSFGVRKSDVEIWDNSLGTGYVIKINDKEYTIVKAGDVNGDGKMNSGDLLTIQKHLLKAKLLETSILIDAADVNNDAKINSADLLNIQKYLLKVFKLEV